MAIRGNYNHTLNASYIGYITQAVVNNFVPLLFLTFESSFHIPLEKITLLVTINFGIQLLVDLVSAKFVDKIGYRVCIVIAHVCAAIGLVGLGIFPQFFADPYWGLLLAIGFYAIGGGLIEVLVSPIVEACPTERKSAAMSLLHSFYCWGSVFVILCSTLFFVTVGISNWRILAALWAVIPALNALYFSRVPIATLTEGGQGFSIRKLFSLKIFWVFVLLMACSGAAELAMSQWASAFAEAGLGVTKTIGDLAGPCLFAVLMGLSRVFYSKFSERIRLSRFMGASAVLCIFGYLLAALSPLPVLSLAGCALCGLSVGILWPGTFSLASIQCPKGGTALFALLALAGDIGCSGGPTMVGMVSRAFGGDIHVGLLSTVLFPVLLILGLFLCSRMSSAKHEKSETLQ